MVEVSSDRMGITDGDGRLGLRFWGVRMYYWCNRVTLFQKCPRRKVT